MAVATIPLPPLQPFIAGAFRSTDGPTFETRDPARDSVIANVTKAFDAWPKLRLAGPSGLGGSSALESDDARGRQSRVSPYRPRSCCPRLAPSAFPLTAPSNTTVARSPRF
jgi:hypothetical protein